MRRAAIATLVVIAVAAIGASAGAIDAGARAPEIGATDLAGRRITIASLRGRVVLVDVWASYCRPCSESMPVYERLHAEHAEAGLSIVGVSTDRDIANVRAFVRRHHVTFPIVHDPRGAIARRSGGRAPSSYLIDRRGIVRHVHAGFHRRDVAPLEREITALLAERR